MGKGTIAKTKIGNIGGMRDKYEYNRRNARAKAELNLDKIFISKFRNIKYHKICDRLNINRKKANSLNLNARDVHRLKVELDRLIREMYDIKNYEGYDLSKTYAYRRDGRERDALVARGDKILLMGDCYDELTDE